MIYDCLTYLHIIRTRDSLDHHYKRCNAAREKMKEKESCEKKENKIVKVSK